MAPSIIPQSLTALATLLPLVHGLGCYTDGGFFGLTTEKTFAFKYLHSSPTRFKSELWINTRDIVPEIYADISTHCQKIANTEVQSGADTWWKDCSDWLYTDKDDDCVFDCSRDCRRAGGDDYEAINRCNYECVNACPFVPKAALLSAEDRGNHLNWEMAHDGHGDEARTLSYDACVAGFKNVHDSCEHGGEMESGGFWFKLDPNTRACDDWRS